MCIIILVQFYYGLVGINQSRLCLMATEGVASFNWLWTSLTIVKMIVALFCLLLASYHVCNAWHTPFLSGWAVLLLWRALCIKIRYHSYVSSIISFIRCWGREGHAERLTLKVQQLVVQSDIASIPKCTIIHITEVVNFLSTKWIRSSYGQWIRGITDYIITKCPSPHEYT